VREIVAAKRAQRPPSRASVIQRLIDAIAPVRSLLVGVSRLPWQATGEHPALDALNELRAGYAAGIKRLPSELTAPRLGAAWRAAIADPDRERAFRALEVATLLALRRAVRNGSVWIAHSLSFRGRERLFLSEERCRIGPAHFSHINFRGTMKFSVEKYADALVQQPTAGRQAASSR
jgi:hypothetical protein